MVASPEVYSVDAGSSGRGTPVAVPVSADPTSAASQKTGHGNNSMMTTAGIIIADVVGGGILAMPVAVAKFGWLLGTLTLTLTLLANVHTSLLLWRVRMVCPQARTLAELSAAVFFNAPPWQRRLAIALTEWPQMLSIFSILSLYLLSTARGMGMLFYDMRVCLPEWAIIAGMVLLPFVGSSREMGSSKVLIWLNVLTLTGTVLIPLIHMAAAGTEEARQEESHVEAFSSLTAKEALSGLSSMTFGFTSQIVLVEIIAEMKAPSEMPKAYACVAAPFQWIAFFVAGVGGYLLIGDKVTGMILENIPFGPAFRVAALCLSMHMLVSYFIKSVVFCKAMHQKVDPKAEGSHDVRSWVIWNVATLLVLISAFFVANLVPFFNALVDLIGASLQPLLCYMLPIGLFLRSYKDSEQKPAILWAEWSVMILEVALSLVMLTFGTFSVVQGIVEDWSIIGAPFACHCQGMWDTCGCSADHVGMADQCAATEAPLPFL